MSTGETIEIIRDSDLVLDKEFAIVGAVDGWRLDFNALDY